MIILYNIIILSIIIKLTFYYTNTNDLQVTTHNQRKQMYQIMKDIHGILSTTNIPYTLCGGSLLGLVRHKGLIPWDDDVDIAIDIKYKEKFEGIKQILNKCGYTISSFIGGYKIYPLNGYNVTRYGIINRSINWPFIDVFFYQKHDNIRTEFADSRARAIWPPEKESFKYSELYPLKLYPFGDFKVYGPANPKAYLNRKFGFDWNIYGISPSYNHIQSHHMYNFKFKLNKKLKEPIIISTNNEITNKCHNIFGKFE